MWTLTANYLPEKVVAFMHSKHLNVIWGLQKVMHFYGQFSAKSNSNSNFRIRNNSGNIKHSLVKFYESTSFCSETGVSSVDVSRVYISCGILNVYFEFLCYNHNIP